MAELGERRDGLGVALQRTGNREYGQRYVVALEDPQHPPQPRPRTVLVERLHAHVAVGERLGGGDLGQERLRRRIPVQDAVFGALFVLGHELDGGRRTAGALWVGWSAAVAHHVPWVAHASSPISRRRARPGSG